MQRLSSVVRSVKLAGISALVMAAGIFNVQAAAAADTPLGAMEHKLVAVCEAIKANSRIELYKAVKNTGISYRRLGDGLVCNGQDMYSFALEHKAAKTGAVIANRTDLDEKTLTASVN